MVDGILFLLLLTYVHAWTPDGLSVSSSLSLLECRRTVIILLKNWNDNNDFVDVIAWVTTVYGYSNRPSSS